MFVQLTPTFGSFAQVICKREQDLPGNFEKYGKFNQMLHVLL